MAGPEGDTRMPADYDYHEPAEGIERPLFGWTLLDLPEFDLMHNAGRTEKLPDGREDMGVPYLTSVHRTVGGGTGFARWWMVPTEQMDAKLREFSYFQEWVPTMVKAVVLAGLVALLMVMA